jgi:microfibrillar-associated protein 1
MSSSVRKAAPRPAKPVAVYRRGRAPKGVAEVASESDSDEEAQEQVGEEGDVPINDEEDEDDGGLNVQSQLQLQAKSMNIALKDVDIKDGKVIVAGREESGRTVMEGKSRRILGTA